MTIHGIGFQQPPSDDPPRAGYADALHSSLRGCLAEPAPGLLGDDPERPNGGPVYVSSAVGGSRSAGMARLARPLTGRPGIEIAHVALVYTPSEPLVSDRGAVTDALARALVEHAQYVSGMGAIREIAGDLTAARHESGPVTVNSTLRPRQDLPAAAPAHRGLLDRLPGRHHPDPSPPTPDAGGMVKALEDDVATYVTRNDLRERVRGFVEDALLSLLAREDVSCLVVNAHSQGTVLSWDVLSRIPAETWRPDGSDSGCDLAHFITAGSPIRKYVSMFDWGNQVGELAALTRPNGPGLSWLNFWDPRDPVADPLNPAADWRPGEDPAQHSPGDTDGLLLALGDDGAARHVTIEDIAVDNVHNSSGGGLQAHDYWNNVREFVEPLANRLAAPPARPPS